jgi:NitT/TauT family transport system substrate-binding protein
MIIFKDEAMKRLLVSIQLTVLLSISTWLAGCSNASEEAVRIAINPWPGYEFLHLAKSKGFFEDEGLNVELIEMASLADVQRVYIQGRADGMASTIIEVVHAAGNTQEALSIVQIPDYSNGGDIILSHESIKSVKELKGKKVGAEVGSLGMYILALALTKHGLSLDDVQILNVEQLAAEDALLNKEIDAVVTYPPFSSSIQKHKQFIEILNTKELPGDVIDSIVLRTDFVDANPQWVVNFLKVWDRTLDYAQANKKEAYGIMADREGISAAEFEEALNGLKLLNSSESQKNMASENLIKNIDKVCQVLKSAKSIEFSCDNINELISAAIITSP